MQTFVPFEALERSNTGRFESYPASDARFAIVVDRPSGGLDIMNNSNRPTRGEIFFGRMPTMYRVDLTEHILTFESTFPCSDAAGGFLASVTYTASVADAKEVVKRGIRDAALTLSPSLSRTLRVECRKFEAEALHEAESAATQALDAANKNHEYDPAFTIRNFALELRLDSGAAKFVEHLKEQRRDRERKAAEAENARERIELEIKRNEVETRLRSAQSASTHQIDLGALQAAIEEDALKQQREAAATRARLETDKEKMTFYRSVLEEGNFGALALQLAQNPDSVGEVAAFITDERNRGAALQMSAFQALLESGKLESYVVSEEARRILQQVFNAAEQQIRFRAPMEPLSSRKAATEATDTDPVPDKDEPVVPEVLDGYEE